MTIGDCAIAAIVFSYVYNDHLAGGSVFFDKGKTIIASNEYFNKYVERLQIELADYLKNRPAAAF